MTNMRLWSGQIRTGVVRWPYGAATRSLVHERDLAAVAARALTEKGHVRTAPVLTGPEALTQAEQLQIIGAAVGLEVRWEEQPPEEAREQLIAGGWPTELVDSFLPAWAAMAISPEPVTDTVDQIIGRPALTLGEWAAEHAADFRRRPTSASGPSDGPWPASRQRTWPPLARSGPPPVPARPQRHKPAETP